MDYKNKYLKYKNKYLKKKYSLTGGGANIYNCYNNEDKKFLIKSKKKKYAYVYILLKSSSSYIKYIIAALVSAYSLKKQNTKYDIVILVDKYIYENYYNLLKLIFDKIKLIEVIFPYKNLIKDIQRESWKYLYNKIHLFKLIEYEKVLMINVNILPLKNYDYIFNYNTPAGIFIKNEYDGQFDFKNKKKYVNREDYWVNEYKKIICNFKNIKELKKKDKKLHDQFKQKLVHYSNFDWFIQGSLLLYQPSLKTYDKLYKIINGENKKYKNLYFTNDEFFFTYFFREEWNFIDNRFSSNILSKKYPYLEYIFGIKYNTGKPFLLNEKNKKKFLKYKEYNIWVKYYKEFINKYPSVKNIINLDKLFNFNL
jgi:hypothetical protein